MSSRKAPAGKKYLHIVVSVSDQPDPTVNAENVSTSYFSDRDRRSSYRYSLMEQLDRILGTTQLCGVSDVTLTTLR